MITDVFFGVRDVSVPQTHWRDMSEFQFPQEGKVVLLLPGGTVDKASMANGCVKRFCESMGDLLTDDVQVIGAYYNDVGVPTHFIQSYKKAGVLNDIKSALPKDELPPAPNFKSFFDKFFLPILLDENKQPKTADEICSILNRFIIVSYCYGGFVAYEIERFLNKQLKQFKFEKKDRAKIFKAFKVVATASRAPMQSAKSTIFHVVSYSDKQKEQNWKATNFQAFVNTKKRREDQPGLILLRPNELVLTAEKLLSVEMDDHHFRSYFKDHSSTYAQTEEGIAVMRFICSFVHKNFETDGKKSLTQLLRLMPEKKFIVQRAREGSRLMAEYKKYILTLRKNFSLQQTCVANGSVQGIKKMVADDVRILPLRNKEGNFLIHMAINSGNLEMVSFLMRHEQNWFQSFNKKQETPILIALKQRNLDMAFLLWSQFSKVSLPVFESYRVLNSMKRRTFKGVLLYVRRIPEAALLLEKIVEDDMEMLPLKNEDFQIIARHLNALKKQRSPEALRLVSTLKKCMLRGVEENFISLDEAMNIHHKKMLPRGFLKELERA